MYALVYLVDLQKRKFTEKVVIPITELAGYDAKKHTKHTIYGIVYKSIQHKAILLRKSDDEHLLNKIVDGEVRCVPPDLQKCQTQKNLNAFFADQNIHLENVGSTSKADDGVKLKADDIRRIKLERNKENSQSANNILPHKSKRLAEDIDKTPSPKKPKVLSNMPVATPIVTPIKRSKNNSKLESSTSKPPSSSEPKATQVSKDNSFEVTSKKQNTEENGIIENEDSVVKVLRTRVIESEKLLSEKDKLITQLRRIIENLTEQNESLSHLNIELQRDVINHVQGLSSEIRVGVIGNFRELHTAVADVIQLNSNLVKPDGRYLSVGYYDSKTGMSHIGRNEWIPQSEWEYAFGQYDVKSFVTHLSRHVYGLPALQTGTVSGTCTRRKNKEGNNNVPPKPMLQLPPNKTEAIGVALDHFLKRSKFDDKSAEWKQNHVNSYITYISQAASDAKRAPRKSPKSGNNEKKSQSEVSPLHQPDHNAEQHLEGFTDASIPENPAHTNSEKRNNGSYEEIPHNSEHSDSEEKNGGVSEVIDDDDDTHSLPDIDDLYEIPKDDLELASKKTEDTDDGMELPSKDTDNCNNLKLSQSGEPTVTAQSLAEAPDAAAGGDELMTPLGIGHEVIDDDNTQSLHRIGLPNINNENLNNFEHSQPSASSVAAQSSAEDAPAATGGSQ